MNINNKHLATLDSVATHIYVCGGRILFSAQLDEIDIKYVDFHNQFLIDGEIDDEWYDSLSHDDRVVFDDYRKIANRQNKDIDPNKIRNISPKMVLTHNININY
jgi:hypothetical protein